MGPKGLKTLRRTRIFIPFLTAAVAVGLLVAVALAVSAGTPSEDQRAPFQQRTAATATPIPYERSDWTNREHECPDTRTAVLIAAASGPVLLEDCRVILGHWTDPWTGDPLTDPTAVEVDHHVPLRNAHASGGAAWSRADKEAFARDRANLRAVAGKTNRVKGAQGPEDWKPDLQTAWCGYAEDWVAVKTKYRLSITPAEREALDIMLATCAPPPTATPVPIPTASHDPQGRDRNCGAFRTWDKARAFFEAAGGPEYDPHNLDGDNDGVPCEALRGAP